MKLETNIAVFGVWTLLLFIVYTWKMYDMQTLHAGGIPMFRGTYLVMNMHWSQEIYTYSAEIDARDLALMDHDCIFRYHLQYYVYNICSN